MSSRATGVEAEEPPQSAIALADIAALAGAVTDFRKVVEALPAAIYLTDAAGRITYYNEAAAALWGHRPVLGESKWCGSWRLYWPDGTPLPHDQCPMAIAVRENRAITGMQAVAERPDGTRVSFLPFPVPLRDASGALTGAVNMLVDVTDRQRAQERVQESEARYRGIFEGARAALWEEDFSAVMALLADLRSEDVTDLRRYLDDHPDQLAEALERVRITDVNSYALELFEADRKEDLLNSLADIFLPETQRIFVEELVALAEGRRRLEGETTLRTLKGRSLDVALTIAFEGEHCERTLVSILDISTVKAAQRAMRDQKNRFETFNRVARSISSDLDLEHIVQTVTDIATEATGAKFGAFFYNTVDDAGESYVLYTLSGASREAFDKFGLPRNTAVFDPTFRGLSVVRSNDIRQDPRYGKNSPHFGMPKGHLPVVSYLAVPVTSKLGTVHGGMFFGHDEAGIFTLEAEDIVAGIAAHAAIAIDNARLLQATQMEVVQRRRAEKEAMHFASIIETSDDAIISKSLDGIIESWNSGAERLFGYSAREAIGQPVTILIPQDRIDEEPGIIDRIRRGERIDHYETVRQRKDGSRVDISLSVSPIKDAAGRIVGASKIARDIAERKRTQEQEKLLVAEIKHRIKNTLATVQAIARQTLNGTPEEERSAFFARLSALANAHDLLTIERWNRAALRDVVDQALRPFQERDGSARLLVSGPEEVWLDAQKSSLLTMILHELATNAVKYGALSNDSGVVLLEWQWRSENDAKLIRISWCEVGGPPVAAPVRRGFGSFLIERTLKGASGGASLDFNPSGLVCTLELAL
jgi:PAS domain S-box-containing protein